MSLHPSIYEQITIQSIDNPDTKVDLRMGVASIDFYENVLCPTMSMRIQVVDAAGSIVSDDTGRKTTIYNGLPIKGGEKVYVHIKANSFSNDDLIFLSNPMTVRGVRNASLETKKQSFTLELVSSTGVNNEVSFVEQVFPVLKISDIAREILVKNLGVSTLGIQIDETSNKSGFSGNNMKPFAALTKLARRGVFGGNTSYGATAGYFVYETRKGMNFKAIDSLIQKPSKATYFYTEVNINEVDFEPTPEMPSLDRKIIKYSVLKNQDMIANLKTGLYASQRVVFNPTDYTVIPADDGEFQISRYNNKYPTLGLEPVGRETTDESKFYTGNTDPFKMPSRILTSTASFGTYSPEVTRDIDTDEMFYNSQSLTRYNSLFGQAVSMLVPLNSQLHAGDIVTIRVPETNTDEMPDLERKSVSGKYMIKEICHHYSADGSFSSMKLVRDTYGFKN